MSAMQLPDVHARFLARALPVWQRDARLLGVAAGGSYIDGTLDEHSDLDLVLVARDEARAEVMAGRLDLAARPGGLLQGFTGEHVGEPRLLICLYGPPLLHVDLKLVSLSELGERIEDPVILWERDGALGQRIAATRAMPLPDPDPQWLEDRFWIWIHYGADKIARGELFECLDMLAFLRGRVLGPLAMAAAARPARGVRRVELAAPAWREALAATVAGHDAGDCARALDAAMATYERLRAAHPAARALVRSPAEAPVRAHVQALRAGLASP